jgi:predicted DsbA family dithiol-disulfide isomerase
MKRRNILRQQVERMTRQGATVALIARRVGLDRKQVRELLKGKDWDGNAPGRGQGAIE